MNRTTVCLLGLALLLPTASVFGAASAYVDYQGAGGTLNNAADWYVISDYSNPASRTGTTRLPALGDLAFVRNTTTGTIAQTFEAVQLVVGSPPITGVATQNPTNLYIANGTTMTLKRRGGAPPLDDNEAALTVGGTYPSTLNMIGGNVTILGFTSSALWVGKGPIPTAGGGGDTEGTGTFNMSGGTIDVGGASSGNPNMYVGADTGSTGIVNMTGGTINLRGAPGPDRYIRIGCRNGIGTFNMSGGVLTNNAMTEVGSAYSANRSMAMFTQTGGVNQADYRLLIGEEQALGHYRFLGGTILLDGGIWLGRFKSDELNPGDFVGCGKMTITQNAAMVNGTAGSGHLIMGMSFEGPGGTVGPHDAQSPDHAKMELKIGSDADFNNNLNNLELWGELEVSLTGGYSPAPGTDWKLFSTTGYVWNNFQQISPGFSVQTRGTDVYVVAGDLRQPGDANNDGFVDVGDLGILAFNWGRTIQTPDVGTEIFGAKWEEADFTGDDAVDVGDLGVLAFNWGWVGTPAGAGANLPEPASLSLLALGGLLMARRRK